MERIQDVEKIRKFNRYYANILGKIDQEIYNHPFTLTEARVISEIHDRKGCNATEVRENLGIDRGYMSRLIHKLKAENILYKDQSPDDKRQYRLYLTKHGEETFNSLVEEANRGVGKTIQSFSKQDLSELIKSMETIETISSKKSSSESEGHIRTFKAGDVGYVAYLHGSLYEGTYGFGRMFEYYVLMGLAEFLLNPTGGELWIAEVDGKIAGSIAITKFNDTIAQLRWFIIDENYQGRGIGKKLMEVALGFCREQNYHHVFLWTVSILEAARHLYKKFNFILTEEKPNDEWTEKEIIEERWDLDLRN
jgi:DNA-binding MarR family transcriptional regulator/N-acetylglutamate synthase-like GNAT family acetyltransferase